MTLPATAYQAMRDIGLWMAANDLTSTEWNGAEKVAALFCKGRPSVGDDVAFLLHHCDFWRRRACDTWMLELYRVRHAVRPLFDARRSKAEIEQAAKQANTANLPWEDVVWVLTDEASRAKSMMRKKHA